MSKQDLPSISGRQLIKLVKKDGWEEKRRANHGISLAKRVGNRNRVTFIPDKTDDLPVGTLMAILGSKQTNIRRKGLINLIEEHGL